MQADVLQMVKPTDGRMLTVTQFDNQTDTAAAVSRKKADDNHTIVKKIGGLLWHFSFYLFIILIISGAVLFKFSDHPDKSFFGFRMYNVLTNSMKQTSPAQSGNFVAGDMIIVRVTPPEEIAVGDIITFNPGDDAEAFLTHRVIQKEKLDNGEISFVTQGDANNLADPEIQSGQVIGRVAFVIPFGGKVMTFIRDNLMFVSIMIIGILVLSVLIKYFISL
ncbi:signal peptidase I [Vagococcus acidifermentans]|uniref:Signal peptidase I n=2 Tax=Vagococcus acidifermentans TaxID=564710 RepID=A0A430AVK0_9ENTE|nr:signal peptidase I [Vagococcus acidifermentans]